MFAVQTRLNEFPSARGRGDRLSSAKAMARTKKKQRRSHRRPADAPPRKGYFHLDRAVLDQIHKNAGSRAVLLYVLIVRDASITDEEVDLRCGERVSVRRGETLFSLQRFATLLCSSAENVNRDLKALTKGGHVVRTRVGGRVGRDDVRAPSIVSVSNFDDYTCGSYRNVIMSGNHSDDAGREQLGESEFRRRGKVGRDPVPEVSVASAEAEEAVRIFESETGCKAENRREAEDLASTALTSLGPTRVRTAIGSFAQLLSLKMEQPTSAEKFFREGIKRTCPLG